jgi:hypothetical protein
MKILCFQVQLKRSHGIDLGAVAALMARIAMSSDVREFTIRRGRGKYPWVNFLFTSASVARTLDRLEAGAFMHRQLGPQLLRSSIITCQGSRGWDNYRLLHHFDSRQRLDRLRSRSN